MAKTKTMMQVVFLIGILTLLTLHHMAGAPGETARGILESIAPLLALVIVVIVTVVTGFWYVFRSELISSSGP